MFRLQLRYDTIPKSENATMLISTFPIMRIVSWYYISGFLIFYLLMKILAALGGNAILKSREKGTEAEQLENLRFTSDQLVQLVQAGHQIAITHGNGPQVGDIFLLYELAKDTIPKMPLDVCGAQSQGMLGYLFQQAMDNALRRSGMAISIATIVTQTIVDKNDPAMLNPTKPIGPFYSKKEANHLKMINGWQVLKDSNRGYRRVVASPRPKEIVEAKLIKDLFDRGHIVVNSGGGGIPVIRQDDDTLRGVEAVIDKDLTASLMASILGVDVFLIITDVDHVYLNYGTKYQRALQKLSVVECSKYLKQNHFAAGSMAPKIEAVMEFVKRSGKRAIITSLENVSQALEGNTGTTITRV